MFTAKPSFSATGLLADYSRRCEKGETLTWGKAGTGARQIVPTVPFLVKRYLFFRRAIPAPVKGLLETNPRELSTTRGETITKIPDFFEEGSAASLFAVRELSTQRRPSVWVRYSMMNKEHSVCRWGKFLADRHF